MNEGRRKKREMKKEKEKEEKGRDSEVCVAYLPYIQYGFLFESPHFSGSSVFPPWNNQKHTKISNNP